MLCRIDIQYWCEYSKKSAGLNCFFVLDIDINECTIGTHKCINAECVNNNGTYSCSCEHGFYQSDPSAKQSACSKCTCSYYNDSEWRTFFLSIVCSDGDVRLMNSSSPSTSSGKGQVEVCYNNSYWAVCSSDWDNIDAGVVCKQLGHPFSSMFNPIVDPQIATSIHWTGDYT